MKAATIFASDWIERTGISIHAAREGGDRFDLIPLDVMSISIHAAREGGDCVELHVRRMDKISIHAAREGGDSNSSGKASRNAYFNPRRP